MDLWFEDEVKLGFSLVRHNFPFSFWVVHWPEDNTAELQVGKNFAWKSRLQVRYFLRHESWLWSNILGRIMHIDLGQDLQPFIVLSSNASLNSQLVICKKLLIKHIMENFAGNGGIQARTVLFVTAAR